jgi:hypothetical protein
MPTRAVRFLIFSSSAVAAVVAVVDCMKEGSPYCNPGRPRSPGGRSKLNIEKPAHIAALGLGRRVGYIGCDRVPEIGEVGNGRASPGRIGAPAEGNGGLRPRQLQRAVTEIAESLPWAESRLHPRDCSAYRPSANRQFGWSSGTIRLFYTGSLFSGPKTGPRNGRWNSRGGDSRARPFRRPLRTSATGLGRIGAVN